MNGSNSYYFRNGWMKKWVIEKYHKDLGYGEFKSDYVKRNWSNHKVFCYLNMLIFESDIQIRFKSKYGYEPGYDFLYRKIDVDRDDVVAFYSGDKDKFLSKFNEVKNMEI